MKYVYFELKTSYSEESYLCPVIKGKDEEWAADTFLADICFCDSYEITIARPATEAEEQTLDALLDEGYEFYEAQGRALHPEVYAEDYIPDDAEKLIKTMEILGYEKKNGSDLIGLVFTGEYGDKVLSFEDYRALRQYIDEQKPSMNVEQWLKYQMLRFPKSFTAPVVDICWSESVFFEKGQRLSADRFDKIIGAADTAHNAVQIFAGLHYGSWERWSNAIDDERPDGLAQGTEAFLGYDKVKFILSLPSGEQIVDRYDIGDGYGGLMNFLRREGNERYCNAADEIESFYREVEA